MATRTLSRSLLRAHIAQPRLQPTQRRTFLPNIFSPIASPAEVQTLSACRTLPYPSEPIYSIIADVPSYSAFLPYCQQSTVTRWSKPDPTYNRRWPSQGILTTGFGNLTESFTSLVYCVPGKIVESVGGTTETSLSSDQIAHHLDEIEAQAEKRIENEGTDGLLTHLRSKWSVEKVGADSTQVTLALEFAFANPLYAAMSAGVAPKVAEHMIQAFEDRVVQVLKKEPGLAKASLADMDGSQLKQEN
jgi:coenzyme Q-binding protein COQ10